MATKIFFTRTKESLFWKISILFFLILVLLGVSYTMITISRPSAILMRPRKN